MTPREAMAALNGIVLAAARDAGVMAIERDGVGPAFLDDYTDGFVVWMRTKPGRDERGLAIEPRRESFTVLYTECQAGDWDVIRQRASDCARSVQDPPPSPVT